LANGIHSFTLDKWSPCFDPVYASFDGFLCDLDGAVYFQQVKSYLNYCVDMITLWNLRNVVE
jgi:hypothetical protein